MISKLPTFSYYSMETRGQELHPTDTVWGVCIQLMAHRKSAARTTLTVLSCRAATPDRHNKQRQSQGNTLLIHPGNSGKA